MALLVAAAKLLDIACAAASSRNQQCCTFESGDTAWRPQAANKRLDGFPQKNIQVALSLYKVGESDNSGLVFTLNDRLEP